MVQQFFRDLTEITGIEAVIIYDNQNNVMDSWSIPKYNPAIFSEVGHTYLHAFGLLEYLQYNFDELAIPFDRGLVFAKTHPRFYVVVLAKATVELSLIRLAVNVAMRDLVKDKKMKKKLKKLSPSKFYQIKSVTLDDVEKIMLENILEEKDVAK